jgi:hypothetical protein
MPVGMERDVPGLPGLAVESNRFKGVSLSTRPWGFNGEADLLGLFPHVNEDAAVYI